MAILQRVSSPLIDLERLDADFYRPDYAQNAQLLFASPFRKHLSDISDKITCGPFGSDLPSSLYQRSGIPLYRVQNVQDGVVSEEGLVHLDVPTSQHLAKCRFKSGDLLIVKSGSIGRVAFVPSDVLVCNVSQDVIGVEIDKARVDSHYLAAFFSSKVGRPQIVRWCQGNAQPHLNLPAVRRFIWFDIHGKAQAYVGDKVRQAEQLRARVRRLEAECCDFFTLPDWNEQRAGSRRAYRAGPDLLVPERLDAPFYDPAHLELYQVLVHRHSQPLRSVCEQVTARWDRRASACWYFEIGNVDLSHGTIKPELTRTRDAPSRAQRLVRPWDVLVSTVRPNRKNVALVPEVEGELPLVASSGFSVLRFACKEAAVFYHAWLRSDAATQQLIQWNAGGSYPAIDDEVPIQTLVPPFAAETVAEHGERWSLKFIGEGLAYRLTTAAKLLVEGLIDGKVTEADLQLAHTDRDADGAILRRLTPKGLDVADEPLLFPDLGRLETALADAGGTAT